MHSRLLLAWFLLLWILHTILACLAMCMLFEIACEGCSYAYRLLSDVVSVTCTVGKLACCVVAGSCFLVVWWLAKVLVLSWLSATGYACSAKEVSVFIQRH